MDTGASPRSRTTTTTTTRIRARTGGRRARSAAHGTGTRTTRSVVARTWAAATPARWTRRRRLDALGVVVAAVLGCEIQVPGVFLPYLSSPCGRLRHVDEHHDPLGMSTVELALPAGRRLEALALRYRLEPGEALSVVLDRGEPVEHVVRPSAEPRLPAGVLALAGGAATGRQPFRSAEPAPGGWHQLTLVRKRSGAGGTASTEVTRDGTALATLAGVVPGRVQLELFPPASADFLADVVVEEARLDDGTRLAPSPWALPSAVPVAAASVGLALAWLAIRGYGPALEALFATRAGTGLAEGRSCVGASLVVAVVLAACASNAVRTDTRWIVRALALAAPLVIAAATRLRVWLARRSTGFARAVSRRGLALRLTLGAAAGAGYAGLAVVTRVAVQKPADIEALAPRGPGTTRVLCYGGSTTRGYPFPAGHAYPERLAALVASDASPPVVENLAMAAGNLRSIAARVPADLAAFRPSHVVIDSVLNDAGTSPVDYAATLRDLVARVRAAGAIPVLVDEPDFDAVYRDRPRSTPLRDALRTVAHDTGAVLVEPMPSLIAHREEFLFMDTIGHFTRRGHERMAELLRDALAL